MGIQAVSSRLSAIDQATLARAQTASANKTAEKGGHTAPKKAGGPPPGGPPPGGPPPGGPPPIGAGGAKPAEASQSSSSSSNSAKIYDPRDTNQDGVVSYQEAQLYSLKHPTDETSEQSKPAASASQQQTGLNAYKQSQKANNTGTSSILSAA